MFYIAVMLSWKVFNVIIIIQLIVHHVSVGYDEITGALIHDHSF